MTLRAVIQLLPIVLLAQHAGAASAPAYPTKPIRIITSDPGGTGDLVSRLIAPGLSRHLGQQVVVDNRTGNVIIPAEMVARATPDGHTMIAYGGTLWLQPLMQRTPYDPIKDFSAITLATSSPCLVVVHPAVAAKSVKELIALAKAYPGKLNYGSGGTGSISHLAPELFNSMAGVQIVRVPYKGAGPAVLSLIAGEVQVIVGSAGSLAAQVKSGKIHALAVTTLQSSAQFPDLPTVTASGVPGFEAVQTLGMLAPAKTPADIVNRLNREMAKALNHPDVKSKLFAAGLDVVANSQQEFTAMIKSELTRMGKVIREAGIKAE